MVDGNTDFFKYVNNFEKYSHINSKLLYGRTEERKKPLITIAIPTYRRPELLKEAIDSALNQVDFEDYEIIVVDNDDDFSAVSITQELIESYNTEKLYYYKNEKNIGMYGNWNRCIELARGEYISILNDDDWLEKDYLVEVVKRINDEMACYVGFDTADFRKEYSNVYRQNSFSSRLKTFIKRTILPKKVKLTLLDMFIKNRSAGTLGTIFKRKSMIKLGGYNEDFFPSSDYYFHVNYIEKHGAIYLKRKLANYRILENESAKVENLKKWPEIDEQFRCYLKKYIKAPEMLLNFMIKEIKKEQINFLIDKWNLNQKNEKNSKVYLFFIKTFNFYRLFI